MSVQRYTKNPFPVQPPINWGLGEARTLANPENQYWQERSFDDLEHGH